MSFNMREYIKKGFIDAIGKMSDYQIILNSAGYAEKGVLTEEDLAEINSLIEEKNSAENTPSSVENSVESAEIQEEILIEEPLILE